MRKRNTPSLPPIAVEQRTESLALLLPVDLKLRMAQFADYFAEAVGERPTSLNAVAVGILTGYLADHKAFQQWSKGRTRLSQATAQPMDPPS